MRKLTALTLVVAGLIGLVSPALAGGDCGRLLREKNAICEMQKRGEGPLTPNLCLPDQPAAAGYVDRHSRG